MITRSIATALLCAATCAALAACDGNIGVIDVSLVTGPGSTVMDDVVHARLILDNPATVVEADRDADGRFSLALDVEANGVTGTVAFEGIDTSGSVIAVGRSAPLPIAAFDGRVDVYVAPPLSLAEAPVELSTARSDIGVTVLSFGVLLAGGRDESGQPTDDLAIYNVYDHDLQIGAPLPEPRFGVTTLGGSFGLVYLFGGTNSAGTEASELWRLDTNVAPAGAYESLRSDSDLARSGVAGTALGQQTFLVAGTPPVIIDGITGLASGIPDGPALTGTATTTTLDGTDYTLIVGRGTATTGAIMFVDNAWVELSPPATIARDGHETVRLPDGQLLVVGGATLTATPASAIRFDPLARSFTTIDSFLATPRTGAAIATTQRHLVVAGGTDERGAAVINAEVFDVETLARIATIPMVVPRTGATAAPLANGQVLIVGGTDSTGAPVATVELFTPGL